jgi:putative acetyltransferase
MKTLETDRLFLREWQIEDASEMLEIYKNPNVILRAGGKVHENLEESLSCIKLLKENQEDWAIVLKESNKVIGNIGLYDINRNNKYKELEFILSESYHNQGYMTEAVKSVLKYAFCDLNLLVVAACHYPYNIQSKRVIEKCGFKYEGTLRKFSKNMCDSVRYSITRVEWEWD